MHNPSIMNPAIMREVIDLAINRTTLGTGGPFAAMVVKGDEIVGRGWNEVVPRGDPTAHAEIQAIRQACERLGSHQLTGCEIYASCEPCPMCLGAIYWGRLDRIWYGATREDAARAGFDDEFLYQELGRPLMDRKLSTVQLMRDEALAVFSAWEKKTDKIPY